MILDIDQSMRFSQKKSLKTNLDDLQSQGSSNLCLRISRQALPWVCANLPEENFDHDPPDFLSLE